MEFNSIFKTLRHSTQHQISAEKQCTNERKVQKRQAKAPQEQTGTNPFIEAGIISPKGQTHNKPKIGTPLLGEQANKDQDGQHDRDY